MDLVKVLCRFHTLEVTHGMCVLFDSSMILFQVINHAAVRTMLGGFPEPGFDRAGIGAMPVGRNALRDTLSDQVPRAGRMLTARFPAKS